MGPDDEVTPPPVTTAIQAHWKRKKWAIVKRLFKAIGVVCGSVGGAIALQQKLLADKASMVWIIVAAVLGAVALVLPSLAYEMPRDRWPERRRSRAVPIQPPTEPKP